jgi:phosphatidylinositol dimannoside acyltransferase
LFSHDSAFFRRLAHAGARHGPSFWVKYSPGVFGGAFALALPEARRAVRDTLRWVRGSPRAGGALAEHAEVLETFTCYAHCLAEALAAGRVEAEQAKVSVLGEEHLTRALAKGRGLIVATAHAGPWDAVTRVLRERSAVDVLVAMQAEPDSRARGFHDGVRSEGGVRIVHVGADPLAGLPLLRHLERGGIVALQLDRGAPSGRAIEVELFGRRFGLPEGPFRLSALTSAPLIPLFARRLGYFDYEIRVSPALELARSADGPALQAAADSVRDVLAAFVRDYPTQWFHFAAASDAQIP